MAVGFRSFLRVAPGQALLDTVIEHLGRWLASKEIHLDADRAGQYVLDHDDLVTVLRDHVEGGQLYRWRRQHPDAQPRDVWRTTITVLELPDEPGWIWTEIETRDDCPALGEAPFNRCMSVPSVLRGLLAEIEALDGRTEIAPSPQWVTLGHLPDLMDYLADETRRGPVYMISQGQQPRDEFERWAREVTWHLVGMGSAFLLDPAVELGFNEMVGSGLAVPPGTMRTYLPEVDLDNPEDPLRHRILGRTRIVGTDTRRLARMLGRAERDRAAKMPIPEDARALIQPYEPTQLPAMSWREQQRRLLELQAEVDRLREALTTRPHLHVAGLQEHLTAS
ncbi:hypothetical protein FHX82_001872 [Amycolatopsis bartoniae]|uniref:Uncharacterized protein n=1 Tax=Amycolatopsis bartoniae TaxID=941986 RepID=A0A8H9IS60_9PSEU|nr:hypothetical protein [Amycolatopsis bartoniae]MBB2934852.1 hypothetical protein [Amycolatopsis bartoniae]TVT03092.1 hypothetical protein FNH07_26280 [Amycolatopsis bartoniae]GHF44331.1 hypothetical protein GCM10017566_16510 [Amycolatopsis bartoniae]